MLPHRLWRRCNSPRAALARHFTSGSAVTPEHSIYISESTDPYFNLTFEDWLFRHKSPEQPLLLLYRDSPCVVIGRNQNPWKEVNLRASRTSGIPFLRRHSGGGTVYHDLGNTNFSIHLPRASFDRHATAQVILRAVRSMGVDANVNDRNDICVGKEKICALLRTKLTTRRFYVSGSAYKIVKDRAYHHGTMLISTQLNTLGELLRSNKDTMETRGVASVRSPVCNLQQYHTEVSHDKFVQAVVDAFRREYGVDEEVHTVHDTDGTQEIEYIRYGMDVLKTWDWAFGQTPEFTYKIQNSFAWGSLAAVLRSKHGIILSCTLTYPQGIGPDLKAKLEELAIRLEGERYGFVDEGVAALASRDRCAAEVWGWLRTEMDS
ncbi:Lipoyltransferase and lipoate-protein ligase [Pilatotrama ljubarskyi]|nr:Lipoyltransferase and lipoate-protein ligase [Pilatotrama ljubarskyi]